MCVNARVTCQFESEIRSRSFQRTVTPSACGLVFSDAYGGIDSLLISPRRGSICALVPTMPSTSPGIITCGGEVAGIVCCFRYRWRRESGLSGVCSCVHARTRTYNCRCSNACMHSSILTCRGKLAMIIFTSIGQSGPVIQRLQHFSALLCMYLRTSSHTS